jgi:hypothetical protein
MNNHRRFRANVQRSWLLIGAELAAQRSAAAH